MIHFRRLIEAKVLPRTEGPVRFAVGPPDGLTSNSWRLWVKNGDVYIKCRDNFTETKVSLHASGRWRMGFTTEAINKDPSLLRFSQNRAWDVWDRPPGSLLNPIPAFRLIFLSSELAVKPEQRLSQGWKDVIHIEAGPPGKLSMVTLFITQGDINLSHSSQPSFCLASLDLGGSLRAQLVVHGELEGGWPNAIKEGLTAGRRQTDGHVINIPDGAYCYFFGQLSDSSRFLIGARFRTS